MGLKCIGKKLPDFLQPEESDKTPQRFMDECRFLSQKVRHPNIVQFLGVYDPEFRDQPESLQKFGYQLPILVLEYLPDNLTKCIAKNGILPDEISYSILRDVALGLAYLHGQTPPIVHRNISSNTILLTASMTAKTSDLGMAKIIGELAGHTETPGIPDFMPPEAMTMEPVYDAGIDKFSYGIVMIHILSGEWPRPHAAANYYRAQGNVRELVAVSEAERRRHFLDKIGDDHRLMGLVRRCIDNDHQSRPPTSEIVKEVKSLKPTVSLASRLELMKHVETGKTKLEELKEENIRLRNEVECLKSKATLSDISETPSQGKPGKRTSQGI